MKYYIAYGSNLNVGQMAHRCPTAVPFGTTSIKNCRLEFLGSPGYSYLTLVPSAGNTVPLGVWKLEDKDEKNLDFYEGYPSLYRKVEIPTVYVTTGNGIEMVSNAFFYLMNRGYNIAPPSEEYLNGCLVGFQDFKLPPEALLKAVERSKEKEE